METVMGNIREMVDVSTVIGDTITTPDGTSIIPVSMVSFGFASGGTDFTGKHQKESQSNPFGGGSGAGVKIIPKAFVVIKDGTVRVMNVEAPPPTTVDKLIDNAPGIIDKIASLINKDKE
jgi:sporulation protein YtfJ